MKDIQFREEDQGFNIRVTGIVVKDGRVLLNRGKNEDFWSFVGGKLTFGESTAEAALREYKEETGAKLRVKCLSGIAENFFCYEGRKWHELLYLYVLEDPDNEFEVFSGVRDIKDNPNGEICWFSLEELDNIPMQPVCSKEMIRGISSGDIDIIVNRDPSYR